MTKSPKQPKYEDSNIQTLDWKDHIRRRPGMYIGKLGNGKEPDDGIYILLKEVIDNSIDEFIMGAGSKIQISIDKQVVSVRDFGRGIPLGKVVDCVSKINTGGKYDSEAFKKSVGLNGVGTKAVNALSSSFIVESYRDGKCKRAEFSQGNLVKEHKLTSTKEPNGTLIQFIPDALIFADYSFNSEFVEKMLWNYAYLNTGLQLHFNNKVIESKFGLKDLLTNEISDDVIYPIIHIVTEDLEVAFSHGNHYGEEHYSFVNGQHTTQGGTHQSSFREAIAKIIKEFYKKDFDANDIRSGIIGAISIRIQEPVFESQTKTKLGSQTISPNGQSIRSFVYSKLDIAVNDFLHKNKATAELLLNKIIQSERERKELQGIKKLARERAKKANLHNKKLRDCRVHYCQKHKDNEKSMLFITEGDSASGSLTKARDVNHQAVFSLKGKPLNTFGLTKKVVYENEEFNLLQNALDIENGLDTLKYNKVVIATDADVDGMHIRLLLLTFFLQFFPELVREKHIYILQTPLFRVRNNSTTHYCYSEAERDRSIQTLKGKIEVTRFKGLGEISPDEFSDFISDSKIRLELVTTDHKSLDQVLSFYMGKNTQERQDFIIENLKIEIEK